jgi:hypothetical protein
MEDGVPDEVVLQVKVLKIEKDGNVYKYEIHTVVMLFELYALASECLVVHS